MKRTLDYQEELIKALSDPLEAEAYLNAALYDENPAVFLAALRDVIEAHGGVGTMARKTDLNRENLYKILSNEGNPTWSSIRRILNGIGVNLSVQFNA